MTSTDRNHPTFTLRSLLIATTFIAILIGWCVDHARMLNMQMELQSRLAGKEKLEDPMERQFMTPTVVGKELKDIPLLEILADSKITSSSAKNFQGAANYVAAPDVLTNTANCQIYWFDLDVSGTTRTEGVVSDFSILVKDGTVTHYCPGESLNL